MTTSTSGTPSGATEDGEGSPWKRAVGHGAPTGHGGSPGPLPAGPVEPEADDRPPPPPDGKPRTLLWFGLAAGGALAAGIAVILVLVSTGFFGGSTRSGVGPFGGIQPPASRPPLARLCPPPSGSPEVQESVPVPLGPRVIDPNAGISYRQLPTPWKAWDRGPWTRGTLGVEFEQGYYFVTENYSGGTYLASVLSGKVPATVGDSLSLDLECAGRQVSEDVRNAYYPLPNAKEQTRSEQTTLGGRPAWVSTFHLTFQADGLKARGETVAVVLVDVGRPDAAVLYISIPDTHEELTPQIETIISSVRRI